jgi:hypothetical protein
LTRFALNSAAKLAPRSNTIETGSVLPLPSLRIESRSFPSQFNSVEAGLGFTLAASLNRTVKFALLIQLEIDKLGFTLAAIFELTREVFLPDQSAAHSKSSAKTAQELFHENTVDICACFVQKVFPKEASGLVLHSGLES